MENRLISLRRADVNGEPKSTRPYSFWIVRFFGAGGKDAEAKLTWANPQPTQLWLSDTSERSLSRLEGSIPLPAWGLLTLRAERSD